MEKVFLGVFIRFLGFEPGTLESGVFRRRGSRHHGKKGITGVFEKEITWIFGRMREQHRGEHSRDVWRRRKERLGGGE